MGSTQISPAPIPASTGHLPEGPSPVHLCQVLFSDDPKPESPLILNQTRGSLGLLQSSAPEEEDRARAEVRGPSVFRALTNECQKHQAGRVLNNHSLSGSYLLLQLLPEGSPQSWMECAHRN